MVAGPISTFALRHSRFWFRHSAARTARTLLFHAGDIWNLRLSIFSDLIFESNVDAGIPS